MARSELPVARERPLGVLTPNLAESTSVSINHDKFYINGAWVSPAVAKTLEVINPATEVAFAEFLSAVPRTSIGPLQRPRPPFRRSRAPRASSAWRCCAECSSATTRVTKRLPRLSPRRWVRHLSSHAKRRPGQDRYIWRRRSRRSRSSSSPFSVATRALCVRPSAWSG